MQTFEEQQKFFQSHWEAMKQAVENGGAPAVIEFIAGFKDAREQRVLYFFARQGLAMDEWQGKNFDDYIAVSKAGIRHLLDDAEKADDAELRRQRLDGANIISFNLAADLADCWPGDDVVRSRVHFETGLQASEDCIGWREELAKGPGPRSMAYWSKGMHQLSLGEVDGAGESWGKSLDYAMAAAKAQDHPATVSATGDFAVILGSGYLGLAQWLQGNDNGELRYAEAIAIFTAQLEDESKKDDAQFGIDQLENVRRKYGP